MLALPKNDPGERFGLMALTRPHERYYSAG
jgi:hypothetical protein